MVLAIKKYDLHISVEVWSAFFLGAYWLLPRPPVAHVPSKDLFDFDHGRFFTKIKLWEWCSLFRVLSIIVCYSVIRRDELNVEWDFFCDFQF